MFIAFLYKLKDYFSLFALPDISEFVGQDKLIDFLIYKLSQIFILGFTPTSLELRILEQTQILALHLQLP